MCVCVCVLGGGGGVPALHKTLSHLYYCDRTTKTEANLLLTLFTLLACKSHGTKALETRVTCVNASTRYACAWVAAPINHVTGDTRVTKRAFTHESPLTSNLATCAAISTRLGTTNFTVRQANTVQRFTFKE